MTTHKNFQVVRTYEIVKTIGPLQKPKYLFTEICQIWYTQNGKETVIARSRNGLVDRWNYYTDLSLKRTSGYYNIYQNINGIVYNKIYLIKKLKERGLKSSFYGANPMKSIVALLQGGFSEKLLKMKQYECFRSCIGADFSNEILNSIRICTKHGYYIKDWQLWRDNFKNLKELGKDICSPKYICPDNLKKDHERNAKKVEELRKKKELEQQKREIEQSEVGYAKDKKIYLGLCFGNEDIKVTVLQNVREFFEEGTAMHHCVFANRYYREKNSLIMSAKDKDGNRLETIEIDLKNFKILQSRAKFNGRSEKHEDIIQLVKNNMSKIKSISTKKI